VITIAGIRMLRRLQGFLILQASDIVVPCSDSERPPNAIIECMAARLPGVCTDTGGDPELVSDGVNGFLAPRNDPRTVAERLLRLLADWSRMSQMGGAETRRIAERSFSLDAMAALTSALYEELFYVEDRTKKWRPLTRP
jgi:glycosyltransferase involved in cell wall biosynthesis